jgi:Zn-dependent protease
VSLATGWPSWAAVAKIAALINLFNLIPIGSLDGGRAFRALSRGQRWFAVLVMGVAWYFSDEGLLVLLALVGVARAATTSPTTRAGDDRGDRAALAWYAVLVVGLTALSRIHVPLGAP